MSPWTPRLSVLRRTPLILAAVLGALTLTPALASAQSATQPNLNQESGNPINDQGSSYNYRSYITSIVPNVPGLNLEVLEFADRLVLTNHTGKTVTVYGYEGEPYARVLADGTVEINTTSPAYYLNQNFYAQVTVPPSASAHATPKWTVLDRTGQFEWHDHRIHWMSPVRPEKITDPSKRTLIFNWHVPIRVGTLAATVNGELFWVPEEDTKTPVAAIVALLAIVLAGIALVIFVRRRRGRGTPPGPGEPAGVAGDAW